MKEELEKIYKLLDERLPKPWKAPIFPPQDICKHCGEHRGEHSGKPYMADLGCSNFEPSSKLTDKEG